MTHPSVDDSLGYRVGMERFLEDLFTSIKLTSENAVRPMGFVEWSPFVFDLRAKCLRGVLIFEALDSISFRPSEKETDHHVIEASVDEVINDRSKVRLATKFFE